MSNDFTLYYCNYYEFTFHHRFVFAIFRIINRSNYHIKIMLIKSTYRIDYDK